MATRKEIVAKYNKSEKRRLCLKRYHNSEKGRACKKRYRDSKKGKILKKLYTRKYEKRDYVKLKKNISSRIRESLHGKKDGISCFEFLPYTLEELKQHLEYLFLPGMTWKNHGQFGWHIDHKRPISSFNITDYECEDFKECWSLNNLQPLWWKDNLKKGAKRNELDK